MVQVSGYIQAPFQGISQAPQAVRLPEQATTLHNVMVEVPEGLRMRPPIDYRGRAIEGNAFADAAEALVTDPDDGSQLYLILNNSGGTVGVSLLRTSDMVPVSVTISPAAYTYINTGDPSPNTALLIREAVDYTMILNREVVVQRDPSLNALRPFEALVWIKSSSYSRTYNLRVQKEGGTLREGIMRTANGNSAASAQYTDTQLIANWLLNGDGGVTTDGVDATGIATDLSTDGFNYSAQGSVIYITHASSDFIISIDDGQGGVGAVALKGVTDLFTNLPNKGPPDEFTIKIADKATAVTRGVYWVKWNTGPGWTECLAPGAQLGLLPTQMPIGLFKSGGLWFLDTLPWKQRTVGDETTALDPLFVGTQLEDIAYFNGRLRIISQEESLGCASDDPFRVYPATLVTSLESDPISSIAPGKSRARFRAAVPFKQSMVIVGDTTTAILSVSPDGTSEIIRELGTYDTKGVRLLPRGVLQKVYFASPRQRDLDTQDPIWLGLYEITLDVIQQVLPEDLTPHVPTLIPGDADRSAGVDLHSCILYGKSGTNTLYLHMFRSVNGQRVQNGWCTWGLPEGYTLGGLLALGTTFHVFLHHAATNTLHVGLIDISPLRRDPSGTILIHVDNRRKETDMVSRVYASGITTVTLPASAIALSASLKVVARGTAGPFPEGYAARILSIGSGSFTLDGNWSSQLFWQGLEYDYEWEPSTIYYAGVDKRPRGDGQLQLDSIEFELSNTSGVSVTTQVGNNQTRSYYRPQGLVGSPTIFTGRWRVPVKGKAQDVTLRVFNDSHLPGKIVGFEFFGDFTATAKRIT